MKRGGHDPEKVLQLIKLRLNIKDSRQLFLPKLLKVTDLVKAVKEKILLISRKNLNEDELREFRTRFGIPISDEEVANAPFLRPPETVTEMKYLKKEERILAIGSFKKNRLCVLLKLLPKIYLKNSIKVLKEEMYQQLWYL
jgi:pyruvate dehydrogenase E1 component